MKTSSRPKGSTLTPRGFTLLELLIVITIIGILAGIAFPVSNSVIKKARVTQCNQQMSNLITSLKGYQLEYGHVPISTTGADSEVTTDNAVFMLSLMGENPSSGNAYKNPREIDFYEPNYTKSGRGGWSEDNQELADPWGEPFVILLDTDFDKKLINPSDTTSASGSGASAAPSLLRKEILIYSGGPDGDIDTWEDNVMSWTT